MEIASSEPSLIRFVVQRTYAQSNAVLYWQAQLSIGMTAVQFLIRKKVVMLRATLNRVQTGWS